MGRTVIRRFALQAGPALLVVLLGAGAAQAWRADDVAGTLNDAPVTLGDVDETVGGAIRKSWREIGEIAAASGWARRDVYARAVSLREAGAKTTAEGTGDRSADPGEDES